MIPAAGGDGYDYEYVQQPTRTYHRSMDKEVIRGYCDSLTAMEQAVYKCLHTERYQYRIYSWNYGVELQDLFGKPIPFVYSELKRRITEALLQDERISDVYDFAFSRKIKTTSELVICTGPGRANYGLSPSRGTEGLTPHYYHGQPLKRLPFFAYLFLLPVNGSTYSFSVI